MKQLSKHARERERAYGESEKVEEGEEANFPSFSSSRLTVGLLLSRILLCKLTHTHTHVGGGEEAVTRAFLFPPRLHSGGGGRTERKRRNEKGGGGGKENEKRSSAPFRLASPSLPPFPQSVQIFISPLANCRPLSSTSYSNFPPKKTGKAFSNFAHRYERMHAHCTRRAERPDPPLDQKDLFCRSIGEAIIRRRRRRKRGRRKELPSPLSSFLIGESLFSYPFCMSGHPCPLFLKKVCKMQLFYSSSHCRKIGDELP